MSIPIAKIKREKGYLYFLDADGDISRCPMYKRKQDFKFLKEKVAKLGIKREKGYLYHIDREGYLCKSPMLYQEKKHREKEPYEKGLAFEKYILSLLPEDEWSIVDYTKDTIKGIPRKIESSSNPDIVLRHRKTNKQVALECKYQSEFYKTHFGNILLIKDYQIKNYNSFSKEKGYPVFIIIGIGGKPGKSEKLFLFPLSSLQYPSASMDYIKKFEANAQRVSLTLASALAKV